MRFLSFFPEKNLQSNIKTENITGELTRFFQKYRSYQLLIWITFKKAKRAIEAFLADPANQHLANLAAKREKAQFLAGASFKADSHLTSHFDYSICDDPQLNSIYACQETLKKWESERELQLRQAKKGDKLPVKLFDLNTSEGDQYKVVLPVEKATWGVEVNLDADPATV